MTAPSRIGKVRGRLRIGLVLDSYTVTAWVSRVIDDLMSADFLQVSPVVLLEAGKKPVDHHGGSWLFQRYTIWDGQRGELESDPLRPVDVSSRLTLLSTIEGSEQQEKLQALHAYDLDVLVWLSSQEPESTVRNVAVYGVWLHRPREAENFWELFEQSPVSRSALEIWETGTEAPQMVCEGFSATEQGWSWRQNRQVPYWRASAFALRCLRHLYDRQEKGLDAIEKTQSSPGGTDSKGVPSNFQMAGFLLRNAMRTAGRRIRFSGSESHWFVAYRTERCKFLANSEELDLRGFRRVPAPDGHFYADPFVTKWQGRNFLFVEDYLFAERRGCISVLEIGYDGVMGEAERVLDLPYHLSYPFVFELGSELYMIPETLAAGRIDLYRATDVRKRWEFVKTLREGVEAVDTTLWVENGLFYFFTNIAERGATVNDDLHLFYAEELLGEWKSHPSNPVVTDVRRSRGAGKLFRRHGKLIRPSQDCSVRYGYACQLNEIEILTTTEYRERPLVRIEPDWAPGLIGTHTINSNEDFEVIDGQVYGKRYARGSR